MNVLITLDSNMGAGLGPNFILMPDVGNATPTTVTKAEILAGVIVTVDNTATILHIFSSGGCFSAVLNLPIVNCLLEGIAIET